MSWNGSDHVCAASSPHLRKGAKKHPSTFSFNYKALFAGVVVVIGAVLAVWLILGHADRQAVAKAKPSKTNPIREVKPAAVPKTVEAAVAKPEPVKIVEHEYGKLVKAVTNRDGAVTCDYVDASGNRRRVVTPPRQIWFNAVDQSIAMALSIVEGRTAAPLPYGITDEDFKQSLKTEILDDPLDTEEQRELRQRVRETKLEIKKRMEEEGLTFAEVLESHRTQMNENTEMYNNALRGLAEVRKNGTAEDVRKYLIVMNAALQQAGVKELPVDASNEDEKHVKGKKE